MAEFYNQATLRFDGGVLRSNVAVGQLVQALSLSKTALSDVYVPGGNVTYVVGLINDSDADLTDVVLTDDLGRYTDDTGEYVPLFYVEGSLRVFSDGRPVTDGIPTVEAGERLTVSGITVPAAGNLMLIYETRVTPFAPAGTGGEIINTAEAFSGTATAAASASVTRAEAPALSIFKAVSPDEVPVGGRVTYTVELTNEAPIPADTALSVEDMFDPVLTDMDVRLDGAPLTAGTGYTYDEVGGLFATVPGVVSVPSAVVTRLPDGAYSVTPGRTVLTVEGTIR